MLTPDWSLSKPHRPLDPGDSQYVARPDSIGGRIADLVKAGKDTITVAGPVGVGKSTELAYAARMLQEDRVAVLMRLDRWLDMRRATVDEVFLLIAGRVAELVIEHLKVPLSVELCDRLVHREVLGEQHGSDSLDLLNPLAQPDRTPPRDLLVATLREVARRTRQGRVALLIDGLEKCGGDHARVILESLGGIPDPLDLVVVVPWQVVYGPGSAVVIRPGEHLVTLRAIDVEGPRAADGCRFLIRLLERRLRLPEDCLGVEKPDDGALPSEARLVASLAASRSGGVPRMFLQLLADAATYARLRGPAPWPTVEHLEDAADDLRDAFRRVLLRGDTDALREVTGTDGREMELERKLRLLEHAVLLEHLGDTGPTLRQHPIVRELLQSA